MMHRWLNHEIGRVHGIAVRRWHLHTLLIVAAALIVGLAAGFFAGRYAYPYRVLPRPPLPPGQTAPSQDCSHQMGGCLPRPASTTPAVTTFTALSVRAAGPPSGFDLSNNDPVPCIAFASIAHHSLFGYLKSVEGTDYFDRTAAPMAACAKARHLPVGGYDFFHVCLVSPTAEALHFVASLRTQGLLGKGTLPPAGDAEYPFGQLSCSGRVWLQTWVDVVYAHDGHVCPILYSGAWWFDPHIGAWWPTCQGRQLLAWISGYGVHYPSLPAGENHLDLWQFSDHGFNGWNYADLSVYLSGVMPFARFAHPGAKPKPKPAPAPSYALFPATPHRINGRPVSERATVAGWDRRHCSNPVRRPACRQLRGDLVLLRGRAWFVAHHTPPPAWRPLEHGRWDRARLGRRFQQINRRLTSRG